MSSSPEVVFATDGDDEPVGTKERRKKVRKRVKVRTDKPKPGSIWSKLSWFGGGVAFGVMGTLATSLAVVQVAPTQEDEPVIETLDTMSVERRLEIAEDVAEAREFIESRLNPVTVSTPTEQRVVWLVENPVLDDVWTWCEKSFGFNETTRVTQCFRVDPNDLDYRTNVTTLRYYGERKWIVSMECSKSDCIFVRTFEESADARDEAPVETTARQERFTWYYDIQTDAQRSGVAARRLLQLTGSDRSPF